MTMDGFDASTPLSVTDLNRRIKSVLEPAFSDFWVSGEISNLRRQSSGHVYFSLKDAGGQISAVLFKQDAARLQKPLADGVKVTAFGRISVYEPRGQYQLIARLVIEDGVGQLQMKFERLKAKLAEEGLFDPGRKQVIPALPRTVAVITSPTGAAWRDFVSILRRRGWRGKLRLLPARVQGVEAALEIVSMLSLANRESLGDLVVLMRGGGSLEDLWPFNEEMVARAVADSSLPVISAVGHQIDFTLSDFASDLRAETPSAAAEWISSSYLDTVDHLRSLQRDIAMLLKERMMISESTFDRLRHRLRATSPRALLETFQLRLDELRSRHESLVDRQLANAQRRLSQAGYRLAQASPENRIRLAAESVRHLSHRLAAVGPESVLRRGYVMVSTLDGSVVSDLSGVSEGETVELRFRDGSGRFQRNHQRAQDEFLF